MSSWSRAAALSLCAVLGGCLFGDAPLPPERIPRFEAFLKPPRIALVLGSGGPRGFAHIGVLKVLDEAGIKPDLVVGSSVGAMVGALYASGRSALSLEQEAYSLNILQFFEMGHVTGSPSTGRAVQDWVNQRVDNKPIEKLGIDFAAAATRQSDGKLVLFTRGDTGLAARASGASPGQFEPVKIGNDTYVDGDEASPVPIDAARTLGAKVVIAVDVSAYLKDTPPSAPPSWTTKDERRARQVAAEAPHADVLIHPNIGYYAGQNEEYRRRVIATAERVAREMLPQIKAAVAKAGVASAEAQPSVTARAADGVTSR